MDNIQLKSYYDKINSCSLIIKQDFDYAYVQEQITNTSIYSEELNTLIGEVLQLKSKLEREITDKEFEYEVKLTKCLMDNPEVKNLTTGKERRDYVNYYVLVDDFKVIKMLNQDLKDITSLLDLAKKKAKDLDKNFQKLKTLWEGIQIEHKFSGNKGSDGEYLIRAKEKLSEEIPDKPVVFSDNSVELLKDAFYNVTETKPVPDYFKEDTLPQIASIKEEKKEVIDFCDNYAIADINELLKDL